MLKKISIISFGNGFSLLVHFLLFPVLAKLAGPEIIGNYGYVYAIIQTIGFVCLFNLNKLLIATDENNTTNIFTGGVLLSFIISILLLIFNYLLDLKLITIITVPLLFFLMVNELLLANLFRSEKYFSISVLTIFKKVSISIMLIYVVYLYQSYVKMLFVALFVEILYFILIFFYVKTFPVFDLNKLSIKLLYNRDFILIKSVQDFLNRISAQLPIIYVKNYIGSGETGQYYFANKMIQNPISVITKAIRSVFFVRLTKEIDSFKLTDYIIITLSYILFAIFGLFSLYFLENLIKDLLDSQWSDSYDFFYYLFPLIISNSMASIFRDKMLLTGRNLLLLYLDVILTIFRFILFLYAIKLNLPLLNYIAILSLIIISFNIITLLFSIKK